MNTKYRISKYLTSVFCGLPIDIETRNKYFLRICQLLLDKLVVIENRLKKQEKNRQTTTYIKFGYVSMDGRASKYAVTYSNLRVNKQFKTLKEQEKYKKRFKNSLKSNKNKWQFTNNGFESKKKKWSFW
ncbi:hypothetical protein RhiirA1_478201 [Rhizophagus irregularis]|uniref:Uncharacterized protein n=1 Tax=Rhizophagus irregularis TaxID=588596 RepID=A0A2N0QSD3_9GLOM|nr:hypothetical protein RhiirA1_478201 [Rhizophagus irregularis]